MRYLRWLFIPFLAILLMSHNTYAIDYGPTGATGYSSGTLLYTDAYGVGGTAYGVANNTDGMSFGAPSTTLATTSIGLSFKNVPSSKFLMSISYRICFVNPNDMKAFIGFSSNNYYYLISNTWEYTSAGCLSGVVTYFGNGGYNNISLGNSGPIIGGVGDSYNIVFNKATYTLVGNDTDYTSILNAIKNNTDSIKDKLDQLESAAVVQEEAAEKELEGSENIENQSTSDINTGDQSSATNLIGNISNIFTQIGNISATNCSIRANFGNLDLGNLNLCTGKENLPFVVTFGAYCFELIFVVGTSIILIKQLLGVLDWSRS